MISTSMFFGLEEWAPTRYHNHLLHSGKMFKVRDPGFACAEWALKIRKYLEDNT